MQYHAKVHQRIVFKEVGKPLYEATTIQAVYQAIYHIAEALQTMYKIEHVHSQPSPGNILIVNGTARLVDLEYAKVLWDGVKRDVRTGIIYTMSSEVAHGSYLFGPQQTYVHKPPFLHNPLHDLESLWWILVWFLFLKVARQPKENGFIPSDTQVYFQYKHAKEFFPSRATGRTTRNLAVQSNTAPFDICVGESFPEYLAMYGFRLVDIRDVLVKAYREAEASLHLGKFDTSPFETIHESFMTALQEITSGDIFRDYEMDALSELVHKS